MSTAQPPWNKYLPVTDYWRKRVSSVREAKGWSQHELAREARISQTAVSNIESGTSKQTEYWQAICRVLKIGPPVLIVEAEWDERWISAGRALHDASEQTFSRFLSIFEDEYVTPGRRR